MKSDISVPFTFGSGAFSGISSNCVLAVPYGTKDAYITKGWTTSVFKGGIKEFMPVVDGIYYGFNSNNKQATVIASENKYSGNVIIPSSVTYNGETYSVTSIGGSAFGGADIPTVISMIENPSAISGKTSSNRTFSLNTFNNATLYVPKGTIDIYEATDGWKDFANIVEGTPTGITSVTSDKETTNALIYDLNGRRLTEPQKGINIIGGKKVLNH